MKRLRTYFAEKKCTPADLFAEIAGTAESIEQDAYAAFIQKIPKAEGEKEDQDLSEEDLQRAFTAFDEEKSGAVSKETFVALLRSLMKVVKDTAMTEKLVLTESKTLRRLETG